MNMNVNKIEKEYFSIEDIMSYSNIEITHVNDNRAPMKVLVVRVGIWIAVIALLAGFFLF